jgi:hypothetical protein
MIEKGDTGVDIGRCLSVQVQFDIHLGFRCFSLDAAGSGHGGSPYNKSAIDALSCTDAEKGLL